MLKSSKNDLKTTKKKFKNSKKKKIHANIAILHFLKCFWKIFWIPIKGSNRSYYIYLH